MGLKYFREFFSSFYFGRILRNTLSISVWQILFGFPAPIILALFLNELRESRFKKVIQNITYIPHFLSVVIIVGMVTAFCRPSSGIINVIIQQFGGEPIAFLQKPEWFKPLYVLSNIWQNMGWNSMIYIGALAGVPPELYESASMDGATRFQKMVRISLPMILPTISILLIMNLGRVMNVGFEKVLIMQNDLNKDASDIISTFVYTRGILRGEYGLSTAVGLFNSVINLALLAMANIASKKLTNNSLW